MVITDILCIYLFSICFIYLILNIELSIFKYSLFLVCTIIACLSNIYQSFFLSIYLSIYLQYLSDLSVHLSNGLFVYLSNYLSIYLRKDVRFGLFNHWRTRIEMQTREFRGFLGHFTKVGIS